jgi:hypothetical protein
MIPSLLAAVLITADEPLYAVPAVQHHWGSGGTELIHGYVNGAGKLIIAPAWDEPGRFRGGYAVVSNGFWSFGDVVGQLPEREVALIDRTGKIVAQHRAILPVSEGRAVICDRGCGWFDPASGTATELKYEGLEELSEGLAAFAVKDKWGYVDGEGKTIIAPKFLYAGPFQGGVARVMMAPDAFGLIDRSGAWIVPAEQRELEVSSDAWVAVRDKDLSYHYVDKHGRAVSLTTKFAYAGLFSGDIAPAMVRKADDTVDYGYIRRDGTWLVRKHSPGSSFPAEAMTGFHDGIAVVAEYRGEGWVYWYADGAGKKLFGRDFDEAAAFADGRALVRFMKNNRERYALIDTKGKTVWEGPTKIE